MLYTINLNWFGKFDVECVWDKSLIDATDGEIAEELNITKKKLQNGFNKFNGIRNNLDGPTFFKQKEDAEKAIDWLDSIKVAQQLNKK